MPSLPAIAGVVKHQIMWSYMGQVAVTVIWSRDLTGITMATRIANERTRLRTWLTSNWAPIARSQASATMLKSWNFTASPPIKSADDPITPAIVGVPTDNARQPAGVTCAVSLRTEAVGSAARGRNGRVYHVGLQSTHITVGTGAEGNTLTSTGIDAIRTAWDALRTSFNTGATLAQTGVWCIIGRQLNGVPNVAAIPVDHLLLNGRVDYQRRRMPRQASYAIGA